MREGERGRERERKKERQRTRKKERETNPVGVYNHGRYLGNGLGLTELPPRNGKE